MLDWSVHARRGSSRSSGKIHNRIYENPPRSCRRSRLPVLGSSGSIASLSQMSSGNRRSDECATQVSLDSTDSPLAGMPAPKVTRGKTKGSAKQSLMANEGANLRGKPTTLPSFSGTVHDVLHSCLENLKLSYRSDHPSFDTISGNSKFYSHLNQVHSFLCTAVQSKGVRNVYVEGAIYVCGVPGVGKTSGVKMCCKELQSLYKSAKLPEPSCCFINAAHLAKRNNPMEHILDEIRRCIGAKTGQSSLDQLKSKLKKQFLILAIDEVDVLVSETKLNVDGSLQATNGLLKCFLDMANDPMTKFALVGISNCIGDKKSDRTLELGHVSGFHSKRR